MLEEELNKLKSDIEYILDGRDYPTNKDKMNALSKYYRYMSESIASEYILIDCDKELLISFESVYLWLQEQFTYLPSHLGEQVTKIFDDARLCELFAILSSLSDKEIYCINKKRRLNNSIGILASMFSRRSVSDLEESQLISQANLVDAKVALNRLCQVTKFAVSKIGEEFYSDDRFEEFSKRYNPDVVNKSRVLALVNLLKSQLDEIEPNEDTKLLIEKLDEVENEINKRKPHWGLILSTLFVIFGFTADLKTLNPDVYDKPLKTIESILFNLHEDGQIDKSISLVAPGKPKQRPEIQRIAIFNKEKVSPE